MCESLQSSSKRQVGVRRFLTPNHCLWDSLCSNLQQLGRARRLRQHRASASLQQTQAVTQKNNRALLLWLPSPGHSQGSCHNWPSSSAWLPPCTPAQAGKPGNCIPSHALSSILCPVLSWVPVRDKKLMNLYSRLLLFRKMSNHMSKSVLHRDAQTHLKREDFALEIIAASGGCSSFFSLLLFSNTSG